MTTKITLPITIELDDPRYCTGCHARYGRICPAFTTAKRQWRSLRYDRSTEQYIRLPQCIAATGGSDA